MCCVRKNTLNSSRGLSTPEYKWVKTEWSGKTEYKLIMIRQLQHALINRLHVTRFIWCIIAVSLTITLPIFHYTITIATGHLVASARSSRTVTLVWRIATVILAITDPFNVDTTPGVTPESKEKIKQEKRTRCITWQRNNIKWAQQRCVEYFRLTVTWTQCLNKYAWDICLHQLRRCSHFHHHISNHREYSVYCGTGTSQPRTGVLNNTKYNTKT